MSSRLWHVTKSILYELQPFRVVDVINFTKYIITTLKGLVLIGVMFSDFAYQSSFYWITSCSIQTWVYVILWFAALASMNYVGFGSLWILFSMFALIFLNLGERKPGELSAYSVFNDGFQQLLGTINAEQFDNEIRHRFVREELEQDDDFEDPGDAPPGGNGPPHHNNRNQRLRARHQQRVARAAAAIQDNNVHNNPLNNLHNDMNAGDETGPVAGDNAGVHVGVNNGGVQVRRKGKKGRRNYEERLVRREAAALQRQQLEDEMEGEFEFDDEFEEH